MTNTTSTYEVMYEQISYGYSVLLFIPVLTILGNILVIFAVLGDKQLKKSVTNRYIAALAFSDFLVGLIPMPLAVYVKMNGERWHLGVGLCKFYVACDVTSSTASILHLVVISADRYLAISWPAEYQRYARKAKITFAIVLVWLLSITLSIPVIMGKSILDTESCWLDNPEYMIYSSLLSFYIPAGVLTLVYVKIFRRIRIRQGIRSLLRTNNLCRNETTPFHLPFVVVQEVSYDDHASGKRISDQDLRTAPTDGRGSSDIDIRSRSVRDHGSSDIDLRSPSKNVSPGMVRLTTNPKSRNFDANRDDYRNHYLAGNLNEDHSNTIERRKAITKSIIKSRTFPTRTFMKEESNFDQREVDSNFEQFRRREIDSNFESRRKEIDSNFESRRKEIDSDFEFRRKEIDSNFEQFRKQEIDSNFEFRKREIDSYRKLTLPQPSQLEMQEFEAVDSKPCEKCLLTRVSSEKRSVSDQKDCAVQTNPRKLSLVFHRKCGHIENIVANGGCFFIDDSADDYMVQESKKYPYGNSKSEKQNRYPRRHRSSSLANEPSSTSIIHDSFLIREPNGQAMMALTSADFEMDASFSRTRESSTRVSYEDEDDEETTVYALPASLKEKAGFNFKKLANRVTSVLHRITESQAVTKEKKATKLVALILGIFIISWLPFFTFNTMRGICLSVSSQCSWLNTDLFFVTSWLGYANSSFNPILYALVNDHFRRTYRRLLRCHWKRIC